MSKERLERNLEIVNLINNGISYRNIAKAIGINLSRVHAINVNYNKSPKQHCVRCGMNENLVLDKTLNICKDCIEVINKS